MKHIEAPVPLRMEERLTEAAQILGVPVSDVFSIKLRPVKALGGVDTDYLWPSDYDVIKQSLEMSSARTLKELGYVCNGKTTLCELDGGYKILFIEHESGPEVILHSIMEYAGAASAVLFAANQAVTLVNNVRKMIDASRTARPRDKSGRFVATSIEKRLKNAQKIIKQVEKTAKASEKAIESVEELFGDSPHFGE